MDNIAGYLVRVEGLGAVKALFLYHVRDDDDARERARTWRLRDPRVRVLDLYAFETLDDRPASSEDLAMYLHTGVKDKEQGDVHNIFFRAIGDTAAQTIAAARGWEKENRLYRCRTIEL
jgi:hypothetical protein